jgi:hypothetical protein
MMSSFPIQHHTRSTAAAGIPPSPGSRGWVLSNPGLLHHIPLAILCYTVPPPPPHTHSTAAAISPSPGSHGLVSCSPGLLPAPCTRNLRLHNTIYGYPPTQHSTTQQITSHHVTVPAHGMPNLIPFLGIHGWVWCSPGQLPAPCACWPGWVARARQAAR